MGRVRGRVRVRVRVRVSVRGLDHLHDDGARHRERRQVKARAVGTHEQGAG